MQSAPSFASTSPTKGAFPESTVPSEQAKVQLPTAEPFCEAAQIMLRFLDELSCGDLVKPDECMIIASNRGIFLFIL